jgi:hypothetical protein
VIFVLRGGDQDLHRDVFSLLCLSDESKTLAATEYLVVRGYFFFSLKLRRTARLDTVRAGLD